MPSLFLTTAWKKLLLANYPVEPAALRALVPAGTELDTWEGTTYVSLVGFQFRDVRVRGLAIPFHRHFPEVNLRFYVRYKDEEKWKRGVVFVREIVPLHAVTFVANNLFHERYITLPMRYHVSDELGLEVSYSWKYRGRWNRLSASAAATPRPLAEGSAEEFITEHFWGYAGRDGRPTGEYEVAHPRWQIYDVAKYAVDCDFAGLYGPVFAGLRERAPASVFLAEGSAVEVYSNKTI